MKKSHATANAPAVFEEPTYEQWAELHRQASRRMISKSVMQGLWKGQFSLKAMTHDEWIARELERSRKCADLGLIAHAARADALAGAWREGYGAHDHYVPHGLKIGKLLDVCNAAGMKVRNKDIPSGGESLPTEGGALTCDLDRIMMPMGRNHHPFMLDAAGHDTWAREEGGDGRTSVEETLYLFLMSWFTLDRIPFMGGWIRCRNTCGSGESLFVGWDAVDGLRVGSDGLADARWYYGAVPRVFQSVGVGV